MAISPDAGLVPKEIKTERKPRLSGFNHISMPVRDHVEAHRFWIDVFGAESRFLRDGFAEVHIAGIILGFSKTPGGWTGRDAEYPHYAFLFGPEEMPAMKARLEAFGVPTTRIWTRNRVAALMYFRDPTGNLFELYCPKGIKDADKMPVGDRAGGDYTIDFGALNYEWKPPAKLLPDVPAPRPAGFNHMTLPVGDIPQACRFWIEVPGGVPGKVSQQVDVGGITLSFNERKAGWTGRDAEFPHYAFTIDGDDMLPMKARLETSEVPTSRIWTRHGVEALMYFRDPTGNLFELYSPQGFKDADKLPIGIGAGGSYAINFGALNYEWKR